MKKGNYSKFKQKIKGIGQVVLNPVKSSGLILNLRLFTERKLPVNMFVDICHSLTSVNDGNTQQLTHSSTASGMGERDG